MATLIETLEKRVKEIGYDAYLVADQMDIRYLTGIPVPQTSFLLVRPNGDHMIYVVSDTLRTAQLKLGMEYKIRVAEVGQPSPLDLLVADLPGMRLRRVGFDALPADVYLTLTEKVSDTTFAPGPDAMWGMRVIKSDEEIEYIRKAAKIADEGQKTAANVIRPGMREFEVAAEVEYTMRVLGSEDEGHRTIVTSGPRTILAVVSGYTTERKIRDGELVVVDTGATINGYRSDIGRTYVAGKPTPKQKEIYQLIRKAWGAAFACVKPGTVAADADVAGRKVLGEYEEYFDHELGHGLGLSFEPPFLGKGRKDVFRENMVVALELGLYIDSFGGMLVEDTVLVTKDGAERLSSPPLDWRADPTD